MAGVQTAPKVAAAMWLACAAPASAGSNPSVAAGHEPPRLAVLIVVDQFGSNLLDMHRDRLGGGVRRLIDHGRFFPNAVVDHAPTNSLPGHLSVATGAYPRRHGIIDNGWVERVDGRAVVVSGFADPACRKLGPDGATSGQDETAIGPGRFEAATIVEWVLAANPTARFASVGTGGGVAALHAGRARGPVLWYDASSGGYVSSTCYLETIPDWALRFNANLAERFMDEDWLLAAPSEMAAGLRPDDSAFENGGRDTHFPHVRPADEALARWFDFTPFVDEATLALARLAVESENLGADAATDILTIGLSSLDHIGHRFGPFSTEQADALHRLDRNLSALLDFLDERVGQGRWVLALTADHGAPPAPEDAARFGIEAARRVSETEALAAIGAARAAAGPAGNSVAAAAAMSRLDFVERIVTVDDLADPADPIERLYAHSYRPGRVSRHPFYENGEGEGVAEYGLIPVPAPYTVVDWATSIHGSPFGYDREVPLLFYGVAIRPGVACEAVRTIDLAPTLAAVLGIVPAGEVDGRVLDLANGEPAAEPCPDG